jgi:hypothetical protein
MKAAIIASAMVVEAAYDADINQIPLRMPDI